MNRGAEITPPFFEVGPKAYSWGPAIVDVARAADELSRDCGVTILLTPQYTDIARVADAVEHVLVFAQHMDALRPGRGQGSVLPEAVKAAGAVGVLLNHVERRLPPDQLAATMRRADEVDLATMVCADDARQAAELARLGPDVIIVEAPVLIAGGRRGRDSAAGIAAANEAIWRVDPAIRVLHGAGINGPRDVYDAIAAGAQAVGSSSAIFTAEDPIAMLAAMIRAERDAWDATHGREARA